MSLDPLHSAQPQAAPLASHLADEANHRIANHLAMLAALMRLEAKGVGRTHIALRAKDAQRLLEEFAGRLETVAEIHRLLAHRSSGAPVDVADYLETIAQGLVSSLTAKDQTSIHCLFLCASFFRRNRRSRSGCSLASSSPMRSNTLTPPASPARSKSKPRQSRW